MYLKNVYELHRAAPQFRQKCALVQCIEVYLVSESKEPDICWENVSEMLGRDNQWTSTVKIAEDKL